MTTPKVSIVLPTYNRAAYLGNALQSVFAQTVGDWQLVVVDDGSTDDTRWVLGRVGDARAEVIHAAHLGQNQAIRAGVAVCTAPWVVFLSDDDELAPNALELYLREMGTGVDVLYGGCVVKWVDPIFGGTAGVDRYWPPAPADMLPHHNVVWGCCFRRSMYDTLGGWPVRWEVAGDYGFWLAAYANGYRFKPVNAATYLYRYHREGQTFAKREKQLAETDQVVRAYNMGELHLPDALVTLHTTAMLPV